MVGWLIKAIIFQKTTSDKSLSSADVAQPILIESIVNFKTSLKVSIDVDEKMEQSCFMTWERQFVNEKFVK